VNKIFSDDKRIFMDNWNSAYGNKILHILFLIHLAERTKRRPVMYENSNLDNIFNFKFETIDIKDLTVEDYYFIEKDSFYIQNNFLKYFRMYYRFYDKNLDSVIAKHYRHFLERKEFLDSTLPNKDIKIRGHFFDYELMPNFEIFNKYLEIKSEVINFIKEKYPDIENKKSVAVHYRGTDFKGFMSHIFQKGLQVDKDYYLLAIEKIESSLGKDITYHLFSDDIEFLKEVFKNKKIVIHNDKAYQDWAAIYLMKNVIQTNSSFCWTASLYNKNISIQPKNGYNYHQQTGCIPYGFNHKNSILIRPNK
jgi:hypothetical protein